MNTTELKKFAQAARLQLIDQVGARLDLVLHADSAVLRGQEKAVQQLQDEIAKKGSREAVVERVAYVWFNRFCALRFMDVNRYSRIGAVSPAEGFSQPEILQDAKQGHIDDDLQVDKQRILDLLGGQTGAADPQQEAYRALLVAVCNSYHQLMPFMFERIADYTELLMPDDLLSENSILQAVRQALTEESCKDVEVIGWLYQFYISEKKDEVFAGLKKNKKITPENIPAATQLFTPHWIVRYLAENSLGRLWMLNRPDSRLVDQMEYYIKPEEPKTDFLRINSPEEIKVCDPACGSGHMLTYAFDLLYAIYEEEGYDAKDIPKLILTRNLYGIEIDERAGELAAFALFMKAREKYRRFFRKPVQPNICVLENIEFSEGELKPYMDEVGRDLFTVNLHTMLHQFEEADNFGSLIRPEFTDVAHIRQVLEEKGIGSNLFLAQTHPKVLRALGQADYLSPKYHVVIANPPYMGGKGMNGRLGLWLKDNYFDVKSDLFSVFTVRCSSIGTHCAHIGIMSPNVWMYISSYAKLRNFLTQRTTFTNLVELPLSGFKGATVQICAYNFTNKPDIGSNASFIRLVDFKGGDNEMAAYTREAINNHDCAWFYSVFPIDFKKIPSTPIAYWISKRLVSVFDHSPLKETAITREGMVTGNNELYLRLWHEVANDNFFKYARDRDEANSSNHRWFSHIKGGAFRKWYGNLEFVVDWENDGKRIRKTIDPKVGRIRGSKFNLEYIFKPNVNWTALSSGFFSARVSSGGLLFDSTGPACFPSAEIINVVAGFLNLIVGVKLLEVVNSTIRFLPGDIGSLPFVQFDKGRIEHTNTIISRAISVTRDDWDFSEVSWDFSCTPLLQSNCRQGNLQIIYGQLRRNWQNATREMQHLEEENNRIFIEFYGLQDELMPEVPVNDITLTCNPYYRYGSNKSEEELEDLLLADTMKEFLSYAVGCMFGRYSLDKQGLILANQGETIEDYLQQIPKPSFSADEDNVIPILDRDWFIDDITSRFSEFLKTTFGTEHYEENLKFITNAIGKDIRKYFLKDFYKDHLKTYKKRPIYWLFSSPKGSFNALIYMHRYRPDTTSVILNDYLREFRTKLIARREHLEQVSISGSASKQEKTKALKEIEKLKKTITELDTYENETLYPLATQNIEIDLDDGVKVNYKKFGKALKKVPGLS